MKRLTDIGLGRASSPPNSPVTDHVLALHAISIGPNLPTLVEPIAEEHACALPSLLMTNQTPI